MSTERFRDRLIAAREAAKLSQTELGRRTEIAPTQISRYEAGRALPRRPVVAKLAKALNVELSWLLDGENDPQPLEILVSGEQSAQLEKLVIPSDLMTWLMGVVHGEKCSLTEAILFVIRRDRYNMMNGPTGDPTYPTFAHITLAMVENERALNDLREQVAELATELSEARAAAGQKKD